jgi:hypothetical protein
MERPRAQGVVPVVAIAAVVEEGDELISKTQHHHGQP